MMIVITETPAHQFEVETTDPINGSIQRLTVSSEGDAFRIAHHWNKLYIAEKMISWLHQRIFALQISGHYTRLINQAHQLLGMIEQCTTVQQLRKVICDNEALIHAIAPGARSRQFGYYQRVIVKIILFCQEMKGVPAA